MAPLVCTVKSSIPQQMGITEQWHTVADTVAPCVDNGVLIRSNGCAQVAALLDRAACGIVLHRADTGLPLWYNSTVRDALGVDSAEFGTATLARILGMAPPRTMAAFQTFLQWQQAGSDGLCRFQMALRDTQGAERFWYACCGRLPAASPAVILSVCYDVDSLLGLLHPSAMPATAVSPERQRAYLSLTAREREMLSELAHGRKTSDIAHGLCISEETVQTHRRNIFRKLGISSALGLAAYMPLLHGSENGHIPENGR